MLILLRWKSNWHFFHSIPRSQAADPSLLSSTYSSPHDSNRAFSSGRVCTCCFHCISLKKKKVSLKESVPHFNSEITRSKVTCHSIFTYMNQSSLPAPLCQPTVHFSISQIQFNHSNSNGFYTAVRQALVYTYWLKYNGKCRIQSGFVMQ